MAIKRILFVCHGNICRSAMAEFILKAMVAERREQERFYIESAAVSNEEMGNPIYPPAKRCLTQHGIWFDNQKRARRITGADYDLFDIIVCMDASNMRLIKRFIPEDTEGKIHMMMSYAGKNRDVADPWYTGDFEQTYRDLTEGCAAMLDKIC